MAETTVLITGATGFLGGAASATLLQSMRAVDSLFLVRASNDAAGLERLRRSLARFRLDDEVLNSVAEHQIVCGDLDEVGEFAGDPRLDSVTHVINCAAITSFSNHPRLWRVNVDGTLDFAKRMAKIPTLRRFLHVSTAMACGSSCDSPIRESWNLPPTSQHLIGYTASKAEGEIRLRKEAPTLPLIVARPSIVVGHSRFGCSISSSIFWVFKMARLLERFTCSLEDRIDVIPVDYCAQALLALTLKPVLQFDLYHVSAGRSASDTFREIDAALANAQGMEPIASCFRRIRSDEIHGLLPEFERRLVGCNRRLIARALRLYGAFSALGYVFDNERLLAEELPTPPRFSSYIDACVNSSAGISLAEEMKADLK